MNGEVFAEIALLNGGQPCAQEWSFKYILVYRQSENMLTFGQWQEGVC